jgi:hypothetical protein
MRGTELGMSLATYDGTRGTVTKDGYTNIDGVKYTNAAIDKYGHAKDFKTAEGTLDQLVNGLAHSGNDSLAKLGASLQFLRNRMGGNVAATIIKGENGYTVKFNMGDAATRGEQSIVIGKDGRFIKGNINTADGNSISITDGNVLINGKDAVKELVDAQKSFEDLKTVTFGRTFAEKLGLKVSEEEARLVANIASKSHNFQDFVKNLTDFADSYTHKDGRKDGHSAGESNDKSMAYGVSIDAGALLSLVGKFVSALTKLAKGEKGGGGGGGGDNPLGPYIKEQNRKGVNENKNEEKVTNNDKTQNVKEGTGVGTLDSYIKELRHMEQNSLKDSKTLNKDFNDIKQASYAQAYREAEKATFTKKLEEQYGTALKPETLEKLEEAVKSGNTRRILEVLGKIASDAKDWKSVEANQFQEKKEQVQEQAGQTAQNVSTQTADVPKQTEDSAAAAQKAEQEARKAEVLQEDKHPPGWTYPYDPFKNGSPVKAPAWFYGKVNNTKQQVEQALNKNISMDHFQNPQIIMPIFQGAWEGLTKDYPNAYQKGANFQMLNYGHPEYLGPGVKPPPQAKDVSKSKMSQNKQNE